MKQRSLLCGTDATQKRKQSFKDKIWTLVFLSEPQDDERDTQKY